MYIIVHYRMFKSIAMEIKAILLQYGEVAKHTHIRKQYNASLQHLIRCVRYRNFTSCTMYTISHTLNLLHLPLDKFKLYAVDGVNYCFSTYVFKNMQTLGCVQKPIITVVCRQYVVYSYCTPSMAYCIYCTRPHVSCSKYVVRH